MSDMRFHRLTPSPDVLMQTVVGESVLLDLRSQKYFGLNEVGTRAWQLLQETGDAGAVRARLAQEYEVADEQLERDLRLAHRVGNGLDGVGDVEERLVGRLAAKVAHLEAQRLQRLDRSALTFDQRIAHARQRAGHDID